MTFKGAPGKPSGRLLVGDKTATGANLYAKRNDDKRVFLFAAFQDTTFNKSPFDLRDKTLVTNIQRDKLDGVEVNVEGKALQFAKAGTNWTLSPKLRVTTALPKASRCRYRSTTASIGSKND